MNLALAGATGLTGSAILAELRSLPGTNIHLLQRRNTSTPDVTTHVVDHNDAESYPHWLELNAGICALGTTIRTAGSEERFREVDFDAVYRFAAWCHEEGATQFHLISSVGASESAGNFYLRVKGEAETAIRLLGFPSLCIYRPGVLLGDRQESRPGEAIARALMPLLNPLLLGSLSRYRGTPVDQLARTVRRELQAEKPGLQVLHNADFA
jgi:uncharacterized protein YbjT (DUF2867 family)